MFISISVPSHHRTYALTYHGGFHKWFNKTYKGLSYQDSLLIHSESLLTSCDKVLRFRLVLCFKVYVCAFTQSLGCFLHLWIQSFVASLSYPVLSRFLFWKFLIGFASTTMTSADFLASSKTKLDQDLPR